VQALVGVKHPAHDHTKGAEGWRCSRNVDLGGHVRAELDALLAANTCWWTTSCLSGRDPRLRPGSLRRLVPQIARCINYLAFVSPSFCDGVRLLDSTRVACGQSRESTRRSEFAGSAGCGYCRSHSRYFWGFPALPALRPGRHPDWL
jgi:hypothetical protein